MFAINYIKAYKYIKATKLNQPLYCFHIMNNMFPILEGVTCAIKILFHVSTRQVIENFQYL